MQSDRTIANDPRLERLEVNFERALSRLETAPTFAKATHQQRLFPIALRLLKIPGGAEVLYRFAPRFEPAGVFVGGDWAHPRRLRPKLVRATLLDGGLNQPVECLSELRILAIATGDIESTLLSPDEATAFLQEVVARNLDLLFPTATEVTRARHQVFAAIGQLFELVIARLGTAGIMAALVFECERLLLQRSIITDRVEGMLRAAALALLDSSAEDADDSTRAHARWMIDALEGPSELAQQHADPDAYREALADLDAETLAREADELGQRMNASGLVCRQHASLLRHLTTAAPHLIPAALALDAVGRTSLEAYRPLIARLIAFAVTPETARCIYGLSRLLNRGILFVPPVPPGLQRLIVLPIAAEVADALRSAPGSASGDNPDAPGANAVLVAGTLSVIGQPRGVDQGHNPTCQAARAISLWSQNDVGYLLDLVARAARDSDLVIHFEGEPIRSSELEAGLAETIHPELDPVSLILTPHLDRIYMEMSRRTLERPGDGHRWVNPELHGWWVDRDFASLIAASGTEIEDLEGFVRLFFAAYHPAYNGGRQLVYAQPCGVVSTTAEGVFLGWHAVSIERVGRDPSGRWRVYFFNPNRDKGQNWGQNVVTSTHDHYEYEGESSLPFEQFASRLYVFHYRERELGDRQAVPDETVAEIRAAIADSWGAGFLADGA